ncbi:MAG: hypothetical protein Q9201_001613 [Fulgogasparrea decipioides]
MSCPMPSSIDSLCQIAPHIILFEPSETRSHRNLYHQMVLNERQILEKTKSKKTRRSNAFPQFVAKTASQWHTRFTKMLFDFEEAEAKALSKSAKKRKIASNYNSNASRINLSKQISARRTRERSSTLERLVESKSAEVGEVKTYPVYGSQTIVKEMHKDRTTITV